MRAFLLGISFLMFTAVYSQDLQPLIMSVTAHEYRTAKQQVDSMLADRRFTNEAAPWFYKGKIYTEAVRRHEDLHPSLLLEALKAYQRYQELDPKNRLMDPDRNVGLFQLYDLSFKAGMEQYEQQKYEPAYWYFRTALETEEYILRKGFSFNGERFPAVDTQMISLVAFSAYLANKHEMSIPYFERLAEMRMSGEEYKGVYTLLTQYYLGKNDGARAAKFLSTGRQLFPDHAHWLKLEFGNPSTEKERFSRYESLLAKYPGDFDLCMDYAIEVFNYCYGQKIPADLVAHQRILQNVLQKALKLQPSSALANAVMSEHVYNIIYDMEQERQKKITGKEDGKAEASRPDQLLLQQYEELYRFSKKAFDVYNTHPSLDNASRQHYRKVLNQLATYHIKKNEKDKAAIYQEVLRTLK